MPLTCAAAPGRAILPCMKILPVIVIPIGKLIRACFSLGGGLAVALVIVGVQRGC